MGERRKKHWGWGWEDQAPSRDELEQAAKGKGSGTEAPDRAPCTEALAFAHLMKGVHW